MQIKVNSFLKKNADFTEIIADTIQSNSGTGSSEEGFSDKQIQYIESLIDTKITVLSEGLNEFNSWKVCLDKWLNTFGASFDTGNCKFIIADKAKFMKHIFTNNYKIFLPYLMLYTYSHMTHLSGEWNNKDAVRNAFIKFGGIKGRQIDELFNMAESSIKDSIE